jgi:phosphatidylinositol alpha-1,6-mannosyltransferase
LRILFISHLHPPKNNPLANIGGMQRVSMQLAKELESRDDVEIKTIKLSTHSRAIQVKVVLFLFSLLFRLPRVIKEFKPDVILFSAMAPAAMAKICRKSIDVPMVTINHGHDVKWTLRIWQKFVPKMFKALDGVISVSKATREESIKRGLDPEKGIVLPNGFDMSDYKDTPDKRTARKEIEKTFDLDLTGKSLLLTVGRQVKRKGHEWFIQEVLPKINSDVFYLVIGDGPEYERLKEVASSSDVKEKILLTGKQPDLVLKNAYAGSDIFIMPNIPIPGDMEGFGIVLLEANLAGTPAVATDLEGIKDVITNGENGYKIGIKDSEAFAQRVDSMIDGDLEKMSISSRRFVLENFTWAKIADRYVSYLKEVADRGITG